MSSSGAGSAFATVGGSCGAANETSRIATNIWSPFPPEAEQQIHEDYRGDLLRVNPLPRLEGVSGDPQKVDRIGPVECAGDIVIRSVTSFLKLDERIRNLMNERGHQHLFLTVDEPDLEPMLLNMMETLVAEADSVRDGIARTVVRNLKVMARMGTFLEDAVRRQYPEFPLRSGIFSWEDFLPPLSPNLRALVEKYDSAPAAFAARN